MSKVIVDTEWLKNNVDAVCCPNRFRGSQGWASAPCNSDNPEAEDGIECVDCWLKYGEGFTPLTPAQERAGDEEEWVVVRKDRLHLHLPHRPCPPENGEGFGCGGDDCAECWEEYLSEPITAEQEGEPAHDPR